MNGFEVKPGKKITANVNIANVRLFIGNIPKNKTKEEIKEEFSKYTGECNAFIVRPLCTTRGLPSSESPGGDQRPFFFNFFFLQKIKRV
jgi:hypothetical protein